MGLYMFMTVLGEWICYPFKQLCLPLLGDFSAKAKLMSKLTTLLCLEQTYFLTSSETMGLLLLGFYRILLVLVNNFGQAQGT